ncbi:ABC transporter permease [Pseudoflavonifractor sp. 524-17]|uniref:methionine ABC transporter permease n=1 Tax=Pseudoflavonifractor sp. 524-17 TaxID=2304577 RepID=UPI00137A55B1|nr:methionine ABC transporter permease [Pseudoflavonifractor sp. 524-17]NCE65182.1 ABC transporter permease [Pseudoflavonifractor sp. 524-17]
MTDLLNNDQVLRLLELGKNGLLFAIWETLYVTVISTFFAYLIGLPLGVAVVAGEENSVLPLPKPVMAVLNFVINILRSVPFLILMVLVIPLSRLILGTSIGTKATVIPLIVAAFPFVARLVEGSLREVDRGMIEAAQSMGCSPLQIITKVILPESLPSLVTGFTTAFITILSYGAMAGAIGGGGLGSMALNLGYQRRMKIILWVSVVVLVILVQIFQSAGTHLAVRMDKRLQGSQKKGALRRQKKSVADKSHGAGSL